MTIERTDPLWPSFWHDVPVEDRAPMRDILADLLSHGVLLGDTGSGRELLLVAREHQHRLADYFAPLGLELVLDEEVPLLQARLRTESCQLLGSFSKYETIMLLTLWRIWDEAQAGGLSSAVTLTLDELYEKLHVYFEDIERPERTQLEDALSKLKRHRLIRTLRSDVSDAPGETVIEVLPSLARVIPFDSIEQWGERAQLVAPSSAGSEEASTGGASAA